MTPPAEQVGSVRLLLGKGEMNTSDTKNVEKKESAEDATVPRLPNIVFPFGDLIAPRREVARIRFRERSQEHRALGVLALGDGSITLYQDGSVGLMSKGQMESLRRRGIEVIILETEAP